MGGLHRAQTVPLIVPVIGLRELERRGMCTRRVVGRREKGSEIPDKAQVVLSSQLNLLNLAPAVWGGHAYSKRRPKTKPRMTKITKITRSQYNIASSFP